MTARRRPGTPAKPSRATAARRRTAQGSAFTISPDVARSLLGISLLVLGAVTLIALLLPGKGALTDWWRDAVSPWFGSGRWVLPLVLLGAGYYVERARNVGNSWIVTLVGATVAYLAALGMLEILAAHRGGRIGRGLADGLGNLVTDPGAFVVLAGVAIGAILVAINRPLRSLVSPIGRGARGLGSALAAPGEAVDASGDGAQGSAVAVGPGRSRAGAIPPATASPGQAGIWGATESDGPGKRGAGRTSGPIPSAAPSTSPVSATFAPAAPGAVGAASGLADASGNVAGSAALATAAPVLDRSRPLPDGGPTNGREASRNLDEVTDAGDTPPTREDREWQLPPITLLAEGTQRPGGSGMDHVTNAAIIVAKLESFNIPARVIRWNAGPVVTQYEVEPDPSVKVSRIESLSDDLAMALAARTIRIEAPIPGKSVVGLEIPNADFNIVALRRILDEVDFRSAGARLTFALGRDVAGHARAVDLAKMPHLLIAGATGSGKSVMVNALITSLLCHATPDELRFILMDLKRVELASYNGLPHLLVPVITEPERAKAALKWTVAEMENRYRRFAGATARNIAGYNESRIDPADRLPCIVVVIDELADLMMREGKNIEEPIVRLAQKARATGIHLVLATQRPSVNVVTGLIKANFPSRIAFAMASQIDSRTILDAPGAEDLIGRGDMLYQPSDLPRPVRMQGVFVSDKEISAITEFWRSQVDGPPRYDLAIVEGDDEGTGSAEDLSDSDADRLLPDAVAVIQEYDRASASLLQRRLKIGYARAARIVDQLEERGYIGPFDGSNARAVLRREVPGTVDATDDEADID